MDFRCAVLILCIMMPVSMGEFQNCTRHYCPHTTTHHTTTTHQTTTRHSNITTHQTTTPLTNFTTIFTNATTHHSTTFHTTYTTRPINTTTHQTTSPQTNYTTVPTNMTTHQTTTFHTNYTTMPVNTTTHQTTSFPTNYTTMPVNTTTHQTTTFHTNYTTMPVNTTTHQTTTFHTNYTTQHPTTMPPQSDFFVNGTNGTCLRITAALEIMFNESKGKELQISIPPPPATKVSGNCTEDQAKMKLMFRGGEMSWTFKKNASEAHFYLEEVKVTLVKDTTTIVNATVHIMDTPLGHSFSCKNVTIKVSQGLNILASGVRAQAFDLKNGEYGSAVECPSDSNSMTVPIVVGVVLVVLVLIVVIAYIFGRHRTRNGYQTL